MDDGRSALLAEFAPELEEHLGELEASLLQFEALVGSSAPTDRVAESLNELFRAAHTIKGSAKMLDLDDLATLAHALEDRLGALRRSLALDAPATQPSLFASRDELTLLLTTSDALGELLSSSLAARPPAFDLARLLEALARLEDPSRQSATPDPSLSERPNHHRSIRSISAEEKQTVRIAALKVDRLLGLAGELLPVRGQARKRSRSLGRLEARLEEIERKLAAPGANLAHLVDELGRVRQSLSGLAEGESRSALDIDRALDDLWESTLSLRMVPIRGAFSGLARLVREIALAEGKSVDLILRGEETELDRAIVDSLADPLVQLVRNSVAHGIEPPGERNRLGKSERGEIAVSAAVERGRIIVTVSDDGQGLVPERIREVARSRGVKVDGRSDAQILDLIFMPGFSTRETADQSAGRGVGLDIVSKNVTRLRGKLAVESEPGRFTSFRIDLPTSLALSRILICDISGRRVALLEEGITEIVDARVGNRGVILKESAGGRLGALRQVDLSELVGWKATASANPEAAPDAREARALILSLPRGGGASADGSDRSVALVVDRVVGEAEALVRPLGSLFEGANWIVGGASLADRGVVTVIDPRAIFSLFA